MRDFDLAGERYATIVLGFNSICHLKDWRDLHKTLECVRRHLGEGGRCLIDVFNPDLRLLMRDPGERREVFRYPDPDGGGEVVVTESNRYDDASQINHIAWRYRIGAGQERTEPLDMRMYFPQERDALLAHNGFAIEHKYGDYSLSPFGTGSPKQLLVCTRRAAR